MPAYRLRIELPDRPGAPAGVTSAIAASQANTISIDVHEIDGASIHGWVMVAIDDPTAPAIVAFVTRPLNVRFSDTEVSRVEALLRLCRLAGTVRPRSDARAASFVAWEAG